MWMKWISGESERWRRRRRVRRAGRRKGKGKKGERNRERRVVDSSCGTLGWRLLCLWVSECAPPMSNGLWRARLSCLVLHPFHHYMPSISPSLNLPVSSLCSLSLFPSPPSAVSSLAQTGLFYIVCKLLGVFNSSSPPFFSLLSSFSLCSVSHLSPSLISLWERLSRTPAHTLNHSHTNTDVHTHTQKELSRVMVFSVIYCTAVVASAFSIGIIIEIT